jgi:hypothetical protein
MTKLTQAYLDQRAAGQTSLARHVSYPSFRRALTPQRILDRL